LGDLGRKLGRRRDDPCRPSFGRTLDDRDLADEKAQLARRNVTLSQTGTDRFGKQ
jgi:hypothetical protein